MGKLGDTLLDVGIFIGALGAIAVGVAHEFSAAWAAIVVGGIVLCLMVAWRMRLDVVMKRTVKRQEAATNESS